MEARDERVGVAIGAIQAVAPQDLQPIVRVAADVDDVRVPLDQPDRGPESAPLEPVLVESIRRGVGCRHHRHAAREEPPQKAREDHRIADVGDEELVEAEHPGLAGETVCHDFERIGPSG